MRGIYYEKYFGVGRGGGGGAVIKKELKMKIYGHIKRGKGRKLHNKLCMSIKYFFF